MTPFAFGTLVGFLLVAITWSAIEFDQVVWAGEGLLRFLGFGIPFTAIGALIIFMNRTSLARSPSTISSNASLVCSGLAFGAGSYVIEVSSFLAAVSLGKGADWGDWYWPTGVTIVAIVLALIFCMALAAIIVQLRTKLILNRAE